MTVTIYIMTSKRRNIILAKRLKRNLEKLTMRGMGRAPLEANEVICPRCEQTISVNEKIVSKPCGRSGREGGQTFHKYYHVSCARKLCII